MKTNMYKKITGLAIAMFMVITSTGIVLASEITGTLSTATITAPVVDTPPVTPPPQNNGGGGGGGGGGSPATTASADINKDGKVDILDFVLLMANWGKIGIANQADINHDNTVDILDFVSLMAGWSK